MNWVDKKRDLKSKGCDESYTSSAIFVCKIICVFTDHSNISGE